MSERSAMSQVADHLRSCEQHGRSTKETRLLALLLAEARELAEIETIAWLAWFAWTHDDGASEVDEQMELLDEMFRPRFLEMVGETCDD